MRTIKFRAWDGEKFISAPSDFDSMLGHGRFTLDGRLYVNGVYQEYELEQFTGLHDKNGKEIYEGDIVLHHDKNYLVKWDELMAAFQAENVKDSIDADFFNWLTSKSLVSKEGEQNSEFSESNCEIIGNIHENPDLLK